MINMIRSINYSTRKNMAVVLAVLSMICLPVLMTGLIMGVSFTEVNGGEYYARIFGESFFVAMFGLMIFSCVASFSDAGDKTLNYEVLAGHSRNRIFFARMIAGVFWGVILFAVLFFYPLVLFGFMGGWYKGISIQDVVLRCLLSLLPLFRVSAFCIMLSSLLRSAGKGIGFTFLAMEIGNTIWEIASGLFHFSDRSAPWVMGMLNVVDLHTLGNAREYVIDGEKLLVYETGLEAKQVVPTVIASLLMGGIYLTIAYIDFKKRDRD